MNKNPSTSVLATRCDLVITSVGLSFQILPMSSCSVISFPWLLLTFCSMALSGHAAHKVPLHHRWRPRIGHSPNGYLFKAQSILRSYRTDPGLRVQGETHLDVVRDSGLGSTTSQMTIPMLNCDRTHWFEHRGILNSKSCSQCVLN
jgi:hypothetical protein